MDISVFGQNYTPIGDVIAIINCILFLCLLKSTYTAKEKNLALFHVVNILSVFAAVFSMHFHFLTTGTGIKYAVWGYVFCKLENICLISMLTLCCQYLLNIVHHEEHERLMEHNLIWMLYICYLFLDITTQWSRLGIYMDENYVLHEHYFLNVFPFVYAIYILLMMFIVYRHKEQFVTKVRVCLQRIIMLAVLIEILQAYFRQSSYTCVTFTFPVLAALFLFHYNSYDPYTGTLDDKSFVSYIKDMRRHDFTLICMRLREIDEKKFEKMSTYFYHFNEQFFKDTCTFRMYGSKMVMVYPNWKNKNDLEKYDELLSQFHEIYEEFLLDYKLTFIKSDSRIVEPERYMELSRYMENKMDWVSYKWCDEEDIEGFTKKEIIANALKDIYEKGDLNDDRVKVYCQPVLNTVTGKFTTAEALMRIVLPEDGMIFPDQFIPIAEEYEYIHVLSEIILNKTCQQILEFTELGYEIERVSVNFSMIELRDDNFCSDVLGIINSSGIDCGKIAIELTESKNERDYELVKQIMGELHSKGIKFYLDDFGTGYSNFERIMGLPIDIIKFDRSLTIMSGKDEDSHYMVDRFSDIFANSDYQILFEGVEDEKDEIRCQNMRAQYLQGYKYSKPIPMAELVGFLEKEA